MIYDKKRFYTLTFGQLLRMPEMRSKLGCLVEPYTCGVERNVIVVIFGSCQRMH